MSRWVTMFSRTGSEILYLVKELNIEPDLIITNKKDFSDSLIDEEKCVYTDNSVESLNNLLQEGDIITLHGYLRILPAEICSKYNIVNGHPGLISQYPELKGKDPQERALNYPVIGSVLHKVIHEVDCGEIINSYSIVNNCTNKEAIYRALSECSLSLWKKYLKEVL